jgi:hypothetical protein
MFAVAWAVVLSPVTFAFAVAIQEKVELAILLVNGKLNAVPEQTVPVVVLVIEGEVTKVNAIEFEFIHCCAYQLLHFRQ